MSTSDHAERIAALIRATGTDDIDHLAEIIADACGPIPLDWVDFPRGAGGDDHIRKDRVISVHNISSKKWRYHVELRRHFGWSDTCTSTREGAKRAADAHHIAAHWAQTKLMGE